MKGLICVNRCNVYGAQMDRSCSKFQCHKIMSSSFVIRILQNEKEELSRISNNWKGLLLPIRWEWYIDMAFQILSSILLSFSCFSTYAAQIERNVS